MTKEIKLGQWVEYLNRVTGGFRCSVCGHQKWETQSEIRQMVAEEVKDPLSEFVTKHTFNTVVSIALAAFAGVFAIIGWLHS